MLHTHKSQSALEYLMTYGWAILIIVIVAVILYSMGIFNPSSSISTTITGFSSTPVSSAIFTDNGGLSLSVRNSVGYPIEITNITATTTTGGKVTIEPNITLLPGKSQVLVLSKVFTASSQNSDISTAVVSTGSITGSTLAVIYPANYTFAAVSKLTITNTQSSATSNPFQQMVNITSADNGWQLISNGNFGQNVEFFYSNGTVIPSWLESYTGSSAIWWLKLGSIPASSSITVYMGIAPTSTNLFNTVNNGEAPQIPCGSTPTSSCSNYAEYDDGANVFYVYFNAKTSLSSFTQYDVSTLSQTTLNSEPVIYFSANSGYGWAGFSNPIPSSFIIDGWVYTTQAGDIIGFVGQAQTSSDSGYLFGGGTGAGGTYVSISKISNGGLSNLANTGSENENSWEYAQVSYNNGNIVISGGDAPQSFSYTTSASDTTYTSGYVGIGESGSDNYNYYRYMFVRAYPPNGVMPSVSFGGVA